MSLKGDLHKRPIQINRNRNPEDLDMYESKPAKEIYIDKCRPVKKT